MIFEKYLEAFKENLFTNNFSQRTIEKYYASTKSFIKFLESYYERINSLQKITKDIISDYQSYLSNYKTKKGINLNNRTQGNRIIGIKKFFNFLLQNDLILNDPTKDISLPRSEETIIRNILTKEEVKLILENIKLISPVNIRNKSIIELVYACGIRTSECCNLKVHDINLKEQIVTVIKGKGNKSRIMPLTQYSVHYLDLYLEKARKFLLKAKLNDPGYIFLTNRGNPFNRSSINKCVIRSILKHSKIKNKHISFYSFRHSLATHLLSEKVDITYIAQLLGHKSLNTTQRYTHVEISDLKKVHSLTHPREKDSLKPK